MKVRALLVYLHDVVAAAAAWVIAYWLRFNLDVPAHFRDAMLEALGPVVAIQSVFFLVFGLYRGMWRFASLPDLKRILMAATLGSMAAPTLLFMLHRLGDVPRSVLLLDPLLLMMMMGGSRFFYRAWKDGHFSSPGRLMGEPVLVLGTGEAADSLLRDLGKSNEWHVVGLLDDRTEMQGRQLNGIRILGTLGECARWARKYSVKKVIIAMPESGPAQRRRAAECAVTAGLGVLTVPSTADMLSGKVAVSQVRLVELEDLLGRETVQLDNEGLHRLLMGKVVLITGAGGSIGSELCRQIIRFAPRKLVFLEQSEFALYSIEQEFVGKQVCCVIGDVKDAQQMAAVFSEHQPDVVFHAAAYKHVPLMESTNAWQAVRNNAQGTLNVARAALVSGSSEFVLISTDKAVNPTNVMGASKRLAELVCQALQSQGSSTRFVMVRFGNVLGSSGSVIPRFREQIAKGGPVTVTHPDIIRFFMLIPEAAQLVLQAGLIASQQQEGGHVFVLDMGEPVKIVDLARDLIRLSGFTEDEIRIEFTGLRPGEKLYEELLADDESSLPTPHPKLRVARLSAAPDSQWLADLEQWLAIPSRPESDVKMQLKVLVPEYQLSVH